IGKRWKRSSMTSSAGLGLCSVSPLSCTTGSNATVLISSTGVLEKTRDPPLSPQSRRQTKLARRPIVLKTQTEVWTCALQPSETTGNATAHLSVMDVLPAPEVLQFFRRQALHPADSLLVHDHMNYRHLGGFGSVRSRSRRAISSALYFLVAALCALIP